MGLSDTPDKFFAERTNLVSMAREPHAERTKRMRVRSQHVVAWRLAQQSTPQQSLVPREVRFDAVVDALKQGSQRLRWDSREIVVPHGRDYRRALLRSPNDGRAPRTAADASRSNDSTRHEVNVRPAALERPRMATPDTWRPALDAPRVPE